MTTQDTAFLFRRGNHLSMFTEYRKVQFILDNLNKLSSLVAFMYHHSRPFYMHLC